ncbi:MAG TPA: dynamin family protein [Micromonosporaceae bacterium]
MTRPRGQSVPAEPRGQSVPARPSGPSTAALRLAEALSALRDAVATAAFPLELPNAAASRRRSEGIVEQLDDYLIPRLYRLDAPLLVVVGGSTGAGKSTLVNSLVRAPVTPTGILRPTTRGPVLVCHPEDAGWFAQARLLPNLARVHDHGGPAEPNAGPDALRIVESPALAPGLAVLDAPDIDSVVESNRTLAEQLLAAADLWLFVTSAARYADAVPWDFLDLARHRGTSVALVLDRVPPGGGPTVAEHLTEMLDKQGLGDAALFVVEEQHDVIGELLPAFAVEPVAVWLTQLAGDAVGRAEVVRRTVDGAVAALDPAVGGLADAAQDQSIAAATLREAVDSAYQDARESVDRAVVDGSMLRGEVLARWQQLVGTGEFMRGLQARVGRARDRVLSTITGRPNTRETVQEAVETGLVALVRAAVGDGAERSSAAWRAHPAGRELLVARPELARADSSLEASADRSIRDWQRDVLGLVQAEAGDRAVLARVGAYTVNALGLAVMIAVFTATAFIPTGAEIAVAGGTTIAAQKVLEAIFGDQAVRRLADQARTLLLDRINGLLDEDAARFRRLLAEQGIDEDTDVRLRAAADAVRAARGQLRSQAGADDGPGG